MEELIASWWTNFEKQAPHIDGLFHGKEEWDLPEWMLDNLQTIHPHLMWEFGPALSGAGHRLVITPESRRDLRPLVREILRRAPPIDGWEFYPCRVPESLEDAAAAVEGRVSGDIRPLKVLPQLGEFNRIDLVFLGFPPETDERQAHSMAFVASESLLGEEVLDRWIGGIDVAAEPPEGERPFAIAEMPVKVMQLIEKIQETLPAHPWYEVDFETGAPWSVLEINSEPAEDCVGQGDLRVAVSVLPALVQNAVSGSPFDSARFSRCGERFCYLKIDGSEGLEGSLYSERSEIDDAINAVLRPAKIGSTVGGGTGHRYSYIELALTDIDRAWHEMRLLLQEGHLPVRTWLLFHDDELSQEWRGLYDDSPAPLMPELKD